MTQERRTDSGIEVLPLYGPESVALDPGADLGAPGDFPFTRGVYGEMYRRRLWTMRQYAGFGSAEETNARFRYLLSAGQTGLSVAFDLPTQMGYDSDHPMAAAEVGRVGVAIDSLADMEALLDGIPLDEVSTSMTINATAAILLLLYELVAEKQGVPPERITGTVQNDILKEYTARGTYIYPPRPSMRVITDLFAYCRERLPRWNTISISGYHMREAGSTAVQEVAFTLADGIAYVEAAREAGLDVDDFGPRLSFFFACHMNFFEEVAKFRAARRLWARIMRERFGATNPKSMMLRFHTQTGGATLTAQQPENNVVRTALEALAAVLGGTQSLHTNSFDEALALPSQKAATIALRTQQVIGYESGVTDTVDPLGGSWFVESLTNEIERRAQEYIDRIDAMGGAVEAIESGWMKAEIEDSAYRIAQGVESGERVVVGVNRFSSDDDEPVEIYELDPALARRQRDRLERVRRERDQGAVDAALKALEEAARGSDNVLYPMRDALAAYATLGEVSDVLRGVFGEYEPKAL
ncbi:MAG TPA: methylmalonyl-CoA mutase family protein [Actinomycetota bacterium]|nr:methylmalonyl-CoA mutase family protein [Actinomycetota bacterium]